ncbi:MAG: tRNA (adenosine(37)-N6)-threonylcarbamoyltransferase complex ATPase subunit type 1 TsaE [Verrucomicrobiota bacterium]|jgi:tRNA threonylcarbamoyladenosine biosynthesis protein TsaE
MVTFISHSPAQTAALGEQWARQARPGWLIGLTGELGAGKTLLAAGVARGLGVTDRVPSPTFTLVHEYRGGRLPLFHLDLFRLASRDDVIAAGLEPYLCRPQGVAVVEWIERWTGATPELLVPGALWRRVEIRSTAEHSREITYEDFGA